MPRGKIAETLDRFFTETAPLEPHEPLLVGFSGGPDSTALLAGLAALDRRHPPELVAAHLDHGLDPDSARRARRAAVLADRIGVRFVTESTAPDPSSTERGLEDWARGVRYDFLERHRRESGARYVAVGHHRDDQVETILLRLLLGSGLEGIGGMSAVRDALVRPLLTLSRRELTRSLDGTGLEPLTDVSNSEIERPRNLVRHRLLPHLEAADPGIGDHLLRVGSAGRRAAHAVADRLQDRLRPRAERFGASIDLAALSSLPDSLWPFALSLLHRQAGRTYPAPASARRELRQQFERQGGIDCDCGDSWHWQASDRRLELRQRETATGRFTYTLQVPGELEIPELGVRFSVRREAMAPWMLEGRRSKAALDLPLASGDSVIVRNRWPGDRIQPLGCRYGKRLKEVLIDRRVPRPERDRLPLLCLGDRIAWVPGVTVDDAYRLSPDSRPWVARIEPS
jgi:tRNA(Ile)-lysidine synthase